jgi:putative serine/threonine protein kinase
VDALRILLLTLGGGVQHAIRVYRQLAELRLEVVEGGGLLINGVSVAGKGTNSVVFRCRPTAGQMELACKLRRGDATRDSLAAEGQLLHLANAAGVGPRIYVYARDVVAYRYVDGVHVDKWWKAADAEKKRAFVKELLDQAFRLDRVGISHNELARLERHVLVERDLPVIIDFESATVGGGSNVTQVANGLSRLGLKLPLGALRGYRWCLCEDAYREVLRFFLDQL